MCLLCRGLGSHKKCVWHTCEMVHGQCLFQVQRQAYEHQITKTFLSEVSSHSSLSPCAVTPAVKSLVLLAQASTTSMPSPQVMSVKGQEARPSEVSTPVFHLPTQNKISHWHQKDKITKHTKVKVDQVCKITYR